MLNILAVGAGGFLGAVCRYLVGLIPLSESFLFPIKTFAINVVGCVLIGVIAVSVIKQGGWNPQLLLFLKVGVCGGFTTFSTFALETADLIAGGHFAVACTYVVLSTLAGVASVLWIESVSLQ